MTATKDQSLQQHQGLHHQQQTHNELHQEETTMHFLSPLKEGVIVHDSNEIEPFFEIEKHRRDYDQSPKRNLSSGIQPQQIYQDHQPNQIHSSFDNPDKSFHTYIQTLQSPIHHAASRRLDPVPLFSPSLDGPENTDTSNPNSTNLHRDFYDHHYTAEMPDGSQNRLNGLRTILNS